MLGKTAFKPTDAAPGAPQPGADVQQEIEARTRAVSRAETDLGVMSAELEKLKAELAKHEDGAGAAKKSGDLDTLRNKLASAEMRHSKLAEDTVIAKQELARLKSFSPAANGKFHGADNDDEEISATMYDALRLPLIAKKTTDEKWAAGGILKYIEDNVAADAMSISDSIDKINKLSNLKNSFHQYLQGRWNSLSENQKAVLNTEAYPNVMDYLIAFGYFVKGIGEVTAMFNFISTNKSGADAVVNYALMSTARFMIKKNGVVIGDEGAKTFNDDNHPLMISLRSGAIVFHEDEFKLQVDKSFKSFIANGSQFTLIKKGLLQIGMSQEQLDELPEKKLKALNAELKKFPIALTEQNVGPLLLQNLGMLAGSDDPSDSEDEVDLDVDEGDSMFEAVFEDDEITTVEANKSNVRCAAQLFGSMIMDTELDLFNLTNYLTNNYLIRNRVDISDQNLANDLQQFVFSNRFTVEKKGVKTTYDRTDVSERSHFYRQVFNFGTEQMPQDVIANVRFPRLWAQLVPAVKKYLEESSSSLSEDTFVSKGGVMQIVAGLKTNAAQFCTSIAKIISPIIDAEWHFIKERILSHPEIVRQVSPTLPSWKGVAETLYSEMKQQSIDASLIYDKARLSYLVLREVAEYEPRKFEEQNAFIDFCSLVIELDNLNASIADDYTDYMNDDGSDPAGAATQEAYANAGIPNIPGMPMGLPMPGYAPAANGNGNSSSNGSANGKGWDF
ncbi:MAG: hypothetical protein EOO05_12325 [Chitinophagaceae bacterium]|nr:MAG: hypothetical protein EOO05_12325 [Chitinophagaceae bacterium]